ncbi:MAG: helix-turn-helix transcriptional regulator [Chloroflexi bacterium]|nr:helix-turn-helix transcriptional regulator [Chloroflexota bacterium]
MSKYGQYCPIAQALEVLGDRWTLLIIRDMLTGTTHFNDLERGLPGISRGLLARRLRQLQQAGVIEKQANRAGRQSTEYCLTQAGYELQAVINALLSWGATWAFDEPSPEELNPVLLMWWMRKRVKVHDLPKERVVIQFNFYSTKTDTFWLVMVTEDVTICLTDPGFGVDVLVTADLATFFKLWLGRIRYAEAIADGNITVEGLPVYVRAFPGWFLWSPAAPAVQLVQERQALRA